MEKKRSIKFTGEKGTKRPKPINDSNTLFVLFAAERTKIHLGGNKTANMNFKVDFPPNILATYLTMPYLKKRRFKIIRLSY